MFSNKMTLIFTYNNKQISHLPVNTLLPVRYSKMTRNINTMNTIIHQPYGTCSSCGN